LDVLVLVMGHISGKHLHKNYDTPIGIADCKRLAGFQTESSPNERPCVPIRWLQGSGSAGARSVSAVCGRDVVSTDSFFLATYQPSRFSCVVLFVAATAIDLIDAGLEAPKHHPRRQELLDRSSVRSLQSID
jgi:hypothetical protein